MSVSLFIALFVGGGVVNILLTQSIKQFYYNRNESASPNVIALVSALVVGGGGTAFAYMLLDVAWTVNNILCLVLMGFAVWIASMVGYDKVIQLLKETEMSQKDIGKEVGWNRSAVTMINIGKNHFDPNEQYPIRGPQRNKSK